MQARLAYPILQPERRRPDTSFDILKDGELRVHDEDSELHFLGKTRVCRYLWPDGVRRAISDIGRRYELLEFAETWFLLQKPK